MIFFQSNSQVPIPRAAGACRQDRQHLEALRSTFLRLRRKLSHQNERGSASNELLAIAAEKGCAVFMLDSNGRLASWNEGLQRFTGYSCDELFGRSLSRLYKPESLSGMTLQEAVGKAVREGIAEVDLKLQRKDGTERSLNVVIRREFAPDGHLQGFAILNFDLTELRSAKESAACANQAKSAFLANMSHEIRTPLNAVMGFSQLLAKPQISAAEREHCLRVIHRNGELLSNIISDILDLSKIEAGKLSIEKAEASLVEILSDLQTVLALQAREKGIALIIDIAPTVPATVVTDALRLRQILVKIIGNAIKFTKAGSVKVRVELEATTHDRRLSFFVTDTGPGIACEQVPCLFTPFMQADPSLTRRHGGTGLGLVLSRRLAKLLGGDVVLKETAPGKGSTFQICIDPGPVCAEGNPQSTTANDDSKTRAPARLDGLNVLVAEDSPDNQFLVEYILNFAGAKVDLAANGKEAVAATRQKKYDVLLMDLQMPVMDGYEAMSKLRQTGYKGQVIALTAHSLKEDRDRCLRSGFDGYLKKPIDRDELLETVAASARQTAH